MKRTLALILTLVFALSSVVWGASTYNGYKVVNVQYEGKTVVPSDVPALLLDGRTMVPLEMLRKIGFDVGWDGSTATANITPKKEQSAPKKVLTKEQIQALDDRIALIYALDEQGVRQGQGSGFFLNSSGLLITAHHVIFSNDKYQALEILWNGKTYKIPAGVAAFKDATKDIAGIYLYDSEPFPYLKIGDLPDEGDKVYALGNPKGERNVLTEGTVDFVYQMVNGQVIGSSATVAGGSSGGALLNEYGEVLGVLTDGGLNHNMSKAIQEVVDLNEKSFNQ